MNGIKEWNNGIVETFIRLKVYTFIADRFFSNIIKV